MNTWQDGEARTVSLAELGERYRCYRLTDQEAVEAMARSLRRYGQMGPVVVCVREDRAEVIDGFKRLAAARLASLGTLRARLLDVDERGAKVAVYGLNRGSRRFQELEEAWLVQTLVREEGLTQVEVAELLDRHKSWVCRRLALLERLCPEARTDMRVGLVSASVGRQLTRLPAGNQPEVLTTMRRDKLTGEEVKGVIDLWLQCAGRAQQEYLLAKPRDALREAQGGCWLKDPRLSPGGNRVARQLSHTLEVLAAMKNWLLHPGLAELRKRDPELLHEGFVRLAQEATSVGESTWLLLQEMELRGVKGAVAV